MPVVALLLDRRRRFLLLAATSLRRRRCEALREVAHTRNPALLLT